MSGHHTIDLEKSAVNKRDFEELAEIRLYEAGVLLDNSQFSGAYYLSGYVVECALKACIAKLTREFDFPNKNLAQNAHTHNLESLLKLAGLSMAREEKANSDDFFAVNWATVKDWNETSRYEKHTESEATDLFRAVADEDGGVFPWIRQYW